MERTTFHDYDSFIAFMEQDIPAEPYENFWGGTTSVERPIPQEVPGPATYFDQYGNEITEEEARQLASVRHVIFAGVYMVEALAALLVYFKLRKR